jgi:AraC family transcriptional regulator, positive regulator of tynA and feaB
MARYNDPAWNFEIGSRTSAGVHIVPAAEFRDLMGEGHVSGASDAPAPRLLMAHVDTGAACVNDLSAAGGVAAANTLMELVKGAHRRLCVNPAIPTPGSR